jgi:hypothetical protein
MNPKCRIAWIDDAGNTTGDDDPAVGEVRCLGYLIAESPSFVPTPSPWIPICAAHAERLADPDMDRWEFRNLENRERKDV